MLNIIQQGFEILTPINGDEMLKRIELAGRVCYKSEGKIADGSCVKFVKGVIKRGHESVIEHESVSVRFICDRGTSHEIVRHRIASFSQESTRYCNYGCDEAGCAFVEPNFKSWLGYGWKETLLRVIWRNAMELAEQSYLKLLSLGAPPQEARAVLPNSLKTEVVMTCNLREWRHFFRLRTTKAAHPQLRGLAILLLREFQSKIPAVFDDIEVDETAYEDIELGGNPFYNLALSSEPDDVPLDGACYDGAEFEEYELDSDPARLDDFAFNEVKFALDSSDHPEDVDVKFKNDASDEILR
jgi:thymidylate synthase (FAD)